MIRLWSELKTMNKVDLKREQGLLREEMRALRFRVAQNQEKKVHRAHELKIALARIATLLVRIN